MCVCVCVCVFMSIHHEGSMCLEQLECQGTDQQCCVEEVFFLRQVPSFILYNEVLRLSNKALYPVHILKAGKVTT